MVVMALDLMMGAATDYMMEVWHYGLMEVVADDLMKIGFDGLK